MSAGSVPALLSGHSKKYLAPASGGSIGPYQYAVLYNFTSATKPLIGWWDYGTAITLTNGNTFTVTTDLSNGILTIT
jgi:hypothetical protein